MKSFIVLALSAFLPQAESKPEQPLISDPAPILKNKHWWNRR
jgi:hypothetical protein